MSDTGIPRTLEPTDAQVAHERLRKAGFERLHINPCNHARPCELWQNKHGKAVTVDYTDTTFKYVWTETLETALNARDSIPLKRPFFAILFGRLK
jgi:hypothetical protein